MFTFHCFLSYWVENFNENSIICPTENDPKYKTKVLIMLIIWSVLKNHMGILKCVFEMSLSRQEKALSAHRPSEDVSS